MRKVLREEKKFLLKYDEFIKYSLYLESVMIPDEHNGYFGYTVRSLYFDTLYDRDYEGKMDGLSIRRKIRLRVYSPKDNFAYLEIKQKEDKYQMKRSLKLSKEDALELINLNYDILLKYDNEFANECHAIMTSQKYIPKTVVEYNRKAYIAKENSIRITFDGHIVASETNFNIFDNHLALYPVFPIDGVVLEVKYNGFLLSYIKSLLDIVNKSELSVSKYCLARQISMNFVYS
ncbi:MAG: polyphosphate polymerase domain-containing protein [Bacilli bacterium]|nr:polyphosphate polymerase domain-containing protein [Bacilli bacterium]